MQTLETIPRPCEANRGGGGRPAEGEPWEFADLWFESAAVIAASVGSIVLTTSIIRHLQQQHARTLHQRQAAFNTMLMEQTASSSRGQPPLKTVTAKEAK